LDAKIEEEKVEKVDEEVEPVNDPQNDSSFVNLMSIK
jgi:hypothetical protein